jgi:predicted ATPase
MKLERLYVKDYRILRNLDIHFERGTGNLPSTQQGYTLDFLVGVNGTGKTTVLQLLSKLFTWLTTRDTFPTEFLLIYTLESSSEETARRIQITNIPERADDVETEANTLDDRLYYRVNEERWQRGKFDTTLLPAAVIIYTTGSEREWMQVMAFDNEPLNGEASNIEAVNASKTPEQPGHRPDLHTFDEEIQEPDLGKEPLFIQATHMALITLCGMLASQYAQHKEAQRDGVLAPVLNALHLAPLQGFSLRVRAHTNLTPSYQLAIISNLRSVADQTIHEGGDQLLIFDIVEQYEKLIANADSIFSIYNQPLLLFRQLYRLYSHEPFYDPPLQEVNLFFKRQSPSPQSAVTYENQPGVRSMLQLFNWLSDGERSFLARMALFALFRADNLLILLDEPEVHFNDVWKREIVHTLDQIMRGHASHALITTHSSIAITDVPTKDVFVLRRDGNLTSSVTSDNKFQTFGADPSDIMVHVFGTVSANGEYSRQFIREEIGRRHTYQSLRELAATVAPGYWRYRIQLEMARMEQVH